MDVHRPLPRPRTVLAWSSGKDSAWALASLRRSGDADVVGLLTTFDQDAGRVSMHAVREALVEAQAKALGLPLFKVGLPAQCSNARYEAAMREALGRARGRGVTAVAFGDLFLQDVRNYREERLAGVGIKPLFPLWGSDTSALASEMVRGGVRAYVTSVDTDQLGAEFVGRRFDDGFVGDLPAGVDPCGEHGEFHTFVYDGPGVVESIPVVRGHVVTRGRFAYADIRLGL